MPSPIAHTVIGTAYFYLFTYTKTPFLLHWRWILLVCAVSLIPDIDFLPGVIIGSHFQYHHGISHSFIATITFGICAACIFRWKLNVSFLRAFLLMGGLYCIHVLLDCVTIDTTESVNGIGMPLFYPVTGNLYKAPFDLFILNLGEYGSIAPSDLLKSMHVVPILLELVVAAGISCLFYLAGRRYHQANAELSASMDDRK